MRNLVGFVLSRYIKHRFCLRRMGASLLALTALGWAASATAVSWKATKIEQPEGERYWGGSINELGQIALVGPSGSYLYENGSTRYLGALPDSPHTEARAINNRGVIVGVSAGVPPTGFAYSRGSLQAISAGPKTVAKGINDKNRVLMEKWLYDGGSSSFYIYDLDTGTHEEVVTDYGAVWMMKLNNNGAALGYYQDGDVAKSFVYSDGAFTDLAYSDGRSVVGVDLNDRGVVAGQVVSDNADTFQAFVYANGRLDLLPSFYGTGQSVVDAMNNEGLIGVRENSRALLYDYTRGEWTDLNANLVTDIGNDHLELVTDLNDHDQIVALSYYGQMYLLTPVPEPETYALLLSGGVLLSAAARRKRFTPR